MNKMLTSIRSRSPEKSQKQALEELDSARVQVIERQPTDQDSSKTLPSHSISLSVLQDLLRTNLLLIASSDPGGHMN